MLWLIGMMGSGKSSVGSALAAVTGLEFVDTDELVEVSTGSTIPDLFDISESVFRDAESQAIQAAADGRATIVATGGGAVLRQTNRDLFKEGVTIWLSATPATLAQRVGDGRNRPLLVGGTAALEELLAARSQLYDDSADFVIETDGCTEAEVVQGILDKWQR